MFVFGIAVLAVYRISYFIALEDGPFDWSSKFRNKIGQKTWVGRGFHCVLCISFWVSLGAALIVNGFILYTIPYWLAVAGAVLVVHKRAF